MKPRRPRKMNFAHLAVRATTPADSRVLYACGDALAYDDNVPRNTTEGGNIARSHTFDRRDTVTCPDCERDRTAREPKVTR